MSDIPDGVDFKTAQMAVAWEIAKKSFTNPAVSGTERAKQLIELFNQAYYGIVRDPKKE